MEEKNYVVLYGATRLMSGIIETLLELIEKTSLEKKKHFVHVEKRN